MKRKQGGDEDLPRATRRKLDDDEGKLDSEEGPIDGIQLVATGELKGNRYGSSAYKLYLSEKNIGRERAEEAPYFFVWLHGMDGGFIEPSYLENMQTKLNRRVVFMVPKNPASTGDGLNFNWGCCFPKKDNKNNLGYVNGVLHKEFLRDLSEKVSDLAMLFQAERTLVMGYSMGGFGAFQLGGFAPDIFDVVVSAAGYGLGTLDGREYGAPQPKASECFEEFLGEVAERMASVPVVMAIHAEDDGMSSFGDVRAIIQRVQVTGKRRRTRNTAELLLVPPEKANSDKRGRKKSGRRCHHYFNYSLLAPSSEDFFWSKLRYRLRIAGPRRENQPLQWALNALPAADGGGMPACPKCAKAAYYEDRAYSDDEEEHFEEDDEEQVDWRDEEEEEEDSDEEAY